MGHGFMPTITIHIYWRWIVDYPITGYVVMEIFSVVGSLVHHHMGGEILPSARLKMGDVHQNGAFSPVWVLHILSPVKNLYVHTIFFQVPLVSNPISSKFHNCNRRGWMSCRSGGTTCSSTAMLGSVGWYIWGGEKDAGDLRFWISSDAWRASWCFRSL